MADSPVTIKGQTTLPRLVMSLAGMRHRAGRVPVTRDQKLVREDGVGLL